jgi:hypothetical protein
MLDFMAKMEMKNIAIQKALADILLILFDLLSQILIGKHDFTI